MEELPAIELTDNSLTWRNERPYREAVVEQDGETYYVFRNAHPLDVLIDQLDPLHNRKRANRTVKNMRTFIRRAQFGELMIYREDTFANDDLTDPWISWYFLDGVRYETAVAVWSALLLR